MAALAMLGCLEGGCTLANRIDACDDDQTVERTINRLTDGRQEIESPNAIGALPDGNAFVVFSSHISSRADEISKEVRATRISPDGLPQRDCASSEDRETTLAAVTDRSLAQIRNLAAFAAPAAQDAPGLVVYVNQEVGRPSEIRGLLVDNPGCGMVHGPFVVAPIPEGASSIMAVNLGALSPNVHDFVVFWSEGGARTSLRARMVRATAGSASFLGTTPAPDGAVVTLASGQWGQVGAGVLVKLASRQLAMLWQEFAIDGSVTALAIFDDRLRPVMPATEIGRDRAAAPAVGLKSVAAAFDGTALLALWVGMTDAGQARLFGRLFDGSGRAVVAPVAPTGAAFRLTGAEAASETRAAVTPFADGGFFVAFRGEGSIGYPDGDAGGIRALALAPDGRIRFARRACHAADFQLNRGMAGDQSLVGLASLPGARIAAVWTDAGRNGEDDRSLSAVRGGVFARDTLFPGVWPMPTPFPLAPASNDPPVAACLGSATSRDGGPCSCASDCRAGTMCFLEQSVAGYPGGLCSRTCRVTADCTPGSVCELGQCLLACAHPGECPSGACSGGACFPLCVSDTDCRVVKSCDRYQALCGQANSTGAGLNAACTRDDDCRSRNCGGGRCFTPCSVARSHCPEDGVCLSKNRNDDLGRCYRPCQGTGCVDPNERCQPIGPSGQTACF